MQRLKETFSLQDFDTTKLQVLYWCSQYDTCSFLDNHHYQFKHTQIECLVAVGIQKKYEDLTDFTDTTFEKFLTETDDWLFGHVGYPNINQQADRIDNIGFSAVFFYQPSIVVRLSLDAISIESCKENPFDIYQKIVQTNTKNSVEANQNNISITPKITKENYLKTIGQLKKHISRGDCYEINFCQEFFANNTTINPVEVYQNLVKISPNPFACFYKNQDKYLLCASPERYIQKIGNKLISQPIKGTFKRDIQNKNADENLKQELFLNAKERSENVMIVDLVRNDLSKICKQGSVQVEELFGLYTFPQVHQMISTIIGEVEPTISITTVFNATFPIGSMTGAPKKKVMQLISEYEPSLRGLYSGAVGYISPNKDFDFNVVIRSIQYNSSNKYINYHVGSGITYNSQPDAEYEECLLKAKAMGKVLSNI